MSKLDQLPGDLQRLFLFQLPFRNIIALVSSKRSLFRFYDDTYFWRQLQRQRLSRRVAALEKEEIQKNIYILESQQYPLTAAYQLDSFVSQGCELAVMKMLAKLSDSEKGLALVAAATNNDLQVFLVIWNSFSITPDQLYLQNAIHAAIDHQNKEIFRLILPKLGYYRGMFLRLIEERKLDQLIAIYHELEGSFCWLTDSSESECF
jgi:hypothetical protein